MVFKETHTGGQKRFDVSKGCLVCKLLGCVEHEQHFVFDCSAYSHIRAKHVGLFQHYCTVADFMSFYEPNACTGFLTECFPRGKETLSVVFTELNSCLLPPSRSPGH